MPPHSTVLVCAGTWDKVGVFSRKACSRDLSPRVNDHLSVVYREARGSWELRTEQSYPRCPARGNNHSTSLEVQFSSHRPGTFFCDQPDALLTPARVGGRQFVIKLSPWALAHKDIPWSPKSKAHLWKTRQPIWKESICGQACNSQVAKSPRNIK